MLEIGQQIDNFIVVKRLGSGGMGEVYLADDQKLKRQVALKVLHSEYFDDSQREERFYREARTAAGITHPNVTAIHNINSTTDPKTGKNFSYIVMEYVEGKTMVEYLKQIGGDISAIVRLSEKIASGLAAAHKVDVVHRDIKADNILLDDSDNPKILDFGLAKPISPVQMGDKQNTDTISQELTQAGKIVGTVSYMSPEQVRGEALDSRSDVFSFGILLYRMITGKLPFDGNTQVSTLAKILESRQEPPSTGNDNIPPELERIIDKCLYKNREDRYQDTRDLVVDLRNLRRHYESHISGSTTGITDAIPRGGITKTFNLSWKMITVMLVVAALATAIITQILDESDSSTGPLVFAGENALAILRFDNKTQSDDLAWLETGLPEILQTDLAENPAISIISRDRVIDCLKRKGEKVDDAPSHQACLDAARTLGAKHALSGAFYKVEDRLRIDARVEELATGKIIHTERVIGTEAFAMVDSLTRKIARSLGMEESLTSDHDVSTFTSSNPEAYKLYLAAMEDFNKELYTEAVDGFKQALALDSTFALPYMRIAMAYVFDGRQQDGAHWLAKAEKFLDKLPMWERNILDIYGDLWLRQNYDDAFVKMEVLVKNYPNEKVGRFIYGLLIEAFQKDTVKSHAQLDTALLLDPNYLFVLTQYAQYYMNYNDLNKALEYALRARKAQPDSPAPLLYLARIYSRQNSYDAAIREYENLLKLRPGDENALLRIGQIHIRLRYFDKSREYVEKVKDFHADDPYIMDDYYNALANLEMWNGQFRKSLDYRHQAIEQYLLSGDSLLIASGYETIGSFFRRFNMDDSCLYYSRLGHEWAQTFQNIGYPLTLIEVDPTSEATARPIFDKALEIFRTRMPTDMWPLLDAVQNLFDSYIAYDTTTMIASFEKISESNMGSRDGTLRTIAFLYTLTGRYQDALEILPQFVSGERITSNGFTYPYVLYHIGLAHEGLGHTEEAIISYREMLKYWDNPDIVTKEIKDARERLSRLTS
ncbi:MAG: protein kinase [FCB group bacterium]|nr:protein kinase [FCB group bacterium]